MIECFEFLGVDITNDISSTNHMEVTAKKAHQCLYLLRKLDISLMSLTNFCICNIKNTCSVRMELAANPLTGDPRLMPTAHALLPAGLPSMAHAWRRRLRGRAARSLTALCLAAMLQTEAGSALLPGSANAMCSRHCLPFRMETQSKTRGLNHPYPHPTLILAIMDFHPIAYLLHDLTCLSEKRRV